LMLTRWCQCDDVILTTAMADLKWLQWNLYTQRDGHRERRKDKRDLSRDWNCPWPLLGSDYLKTWTPILWHYKVHSRVDDLRMR
jgi:hypothetical protein